MTKDQKLEACKVFFEKLAEALSDEYEMLGSCNHDSSVYLIPIGTEDQVTYYGKPKKSFRISDHWNWYANLNKCDKENYIQCLSLDMPWTRNRPLPWKASKPIFGIQVALIGSDGKYHHVFGEKFDRKTKKWSWEEQDLSKVLSLVM